LRRGIAPTRHDTLLERWHAERGAARSAAQIVLDGPGRLGLHRAAVTRAQEQLSGWYTNRARTCPA
jgi:hypothetical protein